MTTFVRNLYADLVDKKLWPLALLLVAGAVAVPVLLSKPAPRVDAGPTGPVATATGEVASGSPVSLGAPGARAPLAGRFKDPFVQQHLPKPSTSTAIGPSTSSSSSSSTSSSKSGSSTSSGGSSSSGGGSTTHQTTSHPSTKLRVEFGRSGGSLKRYDLAALSPLPSSGNPVLIYLGLLKDGKTASFLVSSDATPQGDGSCKPSRSLCQTLYLKAGDSEFIDVLLDSGATVQYQLDVKQVVTG